MYITEMQSRKEGTSAGALCFPSHREGPGTKGPDTGCIACMSPVAAQNVQSTGKSKIMHTAMLSHAAFPQIQS